jgi:predicted nucleic acid-binding protein
MNEDKIFVDTNILVYGHDADAGHNMEWDEVFWRNFGIAAREF